MSNSPDWPGSFPAPDVPCSEQAAQQQHALTKPPGSLGRLETLAITLCGQQATTTPAVDRVAICVFAADHGVCAEGISAFPQAVTGQMVVNFARGGAAICVLARELGATLEVVNLGTVAPLPELPGVLDHTIAAGTANLAVRDAMSPEQAAQAMHEGEQAAQRALEQEAHLFIGGDMGIGNTTSAAALACALLGARPDELAGPGTGLDPAGVGHKAQVISRALHRHQTHHGVDATNPLVALASLGGFEIAALTGAILGCAARRIPVLVDGYMVSVAALVAVRQQPAVGAWLHFSHRSAEPGHTLVLNALDARPLLDLGMRLGEGSGAAVAVPLLRAACALHNGMASFADAGVSDGQ
ncbi:nicotinate-nucleotide--dimethylbenzimidazole phosphoribosyltransferase [Marinobacter sp. X15-166B]|uniref:nicotinate-nucleotide--dimethylbenzimidazole phosphoribosyltransferase n=1 Tax=Marinobacter sp. X15-166B TaxID=1897620 RepID=UPI00085C69EB|nr:nicotinate-nucleotide--dimethylbenzimidazole phosphoribosyltransferase [Marinobacter sp. X15-166B]OEY66235.1 nicotinate-nucleotide--dimethylbenzimidazole phosphoribosyltransferase [Marinobacter sp. X15-166B]